MVEARPNHGRASWWLRPRRKVERVASWHAYAEAWAVLTALNTSEAEAAELFLTFNLEDFPRLREPGGPRIVALPDPPGLPPPPE